MADQGFRVVVVLVALVLKLVVVLILVVVKSILQIGMDDDRPSLAIDAVSSGHLTILLNPLWFH